MGILGVSRQHSQHWAAPLTSSSHPRLSQHQSRSKEFYESKYWSDNANHDHTAGEGSGSPTETSIRGKPKSPQSIRSLAGEPQQVSQVSGLRSNDPDTQQNNFTIRVIISQFPRGRLEIMRA